jgi:tRNA(Ile)-lysidine synthase TilS/MesJ
MICKIKETVQKYGMFNENKNVVVGVSGGADSCALLWALCNIKEKYSLKKIRCVFATDFLVLKQKFFSLRC